MRSASRARLVERKTWLPPLFGINHRWRRLRHAQSACIVASGLSSQCRGLRLKDWRGVHWSNWKENWYARFQFYKTLSKANIQNDMISRWLISKLTFGEVLLRNQEHTLPVHFLFPPTFLTLASGRRSEVTSTVRQVRLPKLEKKRAAFDVRRYPDVQRKGGFTNRERISNFTARYLCVSFLRVCLYFSFLSLLQRQRLYPNSHAAPLRSPLD